jgi:hypothetical protein
MFMVRWSQVPWCSGRYLDGVLVAALVVFWSLTSWWAGRWQGGTLAAFTGRPW